MISQEENNQLTQTSAKTPAGELLRRYWQPVGLSEELPQGGPPRTVKIMGEELVLFRDDQGRPGLLGLHCSHRGTDLSYGRIEDGGLRCLYHGWLYDVRGCVLEQPGEPGGGANRSEIRHRAYPCQEAGGIVFTFMGAGEPPLLPNYEFLNVSAQQRCVAKVRYRCNYLQGNEGNIDPVHLSFLHQYLPDAKPPLQRVVPGSEATDNTLLKKDIAPTIEVELTDFGLRIYSTRESEPGKRYLRVTNFVMPNASAFGGSTVGEGYSVHWHVPIDDTSHWKYLFMFSRERALGPELVAKNRADMTPGYELARSADNRYQQDRESMATKSFTGMGFNFQAHDAFATESQGRIQNRTDEHLVTSDKAIVAARKLLLKGMADAGEGRDPQHVVRASDANRFLHLQVFSEVITDSVDFKQHTRERIAAIEKRYSK
jgi:phthalate 4,5-dioxygenase oxygenase subunit